MGPIGCPKTLVRNYHYMLHSNTEQCSFQLVLNPLNAELNPICHLLALLGVATIVVVSRLRVKSQLTPYKEHNLSRS